MLGTGIASADEDVNPDRPASPLDGSVRVPVHLDNNGLGTPLGQKNLPVVDKEMRVSPTDATNALPVADKAANTATGTVSDQAAPALGTASGSVDPTLAKVHQQARPVLDKAKPVTDRANAAAAKAGMPAMPALPTMSVPKTEGAFHGNRIDGDLVVPIDVSGNAVALLGAAAVENDSYQSYSDSESVVTDGAGGFLAGNVVDLDWALPVQITGNAVAGLGKASSISSAEQDTTVTSDVESDGSEGVLSGNVLAGHWATPLQLTGNAVAGGGKAQSESTADSTATSGGTVLTSGASSLGGGNIGAAPIATPAEGNGNGIAGLGKADASSASSATATAGAVREGLYGVPTYLETNGDPAVGAGNVVEPAASGPALLCGNAGAAVGGSTADCTSDTATSAGEGATRSTGEESVLSGSAGTVPVALPAEGFGNAAAGVGDAEATADNTVDSVAGGDSYTRGHDGLLSGTTGSAPVAGPVDVFANSTAGAGAADATATQDATSTAGGNTGTTGDNSAGGGNMVTSPVSLPVEGFGNVAAGAGGATASGTEVKTTTTGGGSNTDDDGGLLASNLVNTPLAGAAQAFGNGGGAVAFTDADASTDNEVTAGGPSQATGTGGAGSGNIGQLPASVPVQLFGSGASGLAGGEQTAESDTDMTAGGDATSDGVGGFLSGNVASGPVGSAGQAFGESAAVLGVNDSEASSTTSSVAGGAVETDGSSGLGTGNVASPQALPVAQSFAAAASGLGGVNSADADNTSAVASGGDIDTAGDGGFLAGNLADVPGGAVAQPFGDAVSVVASSSEASGDSVSGNMVGGTSTTSGGSLGSLSGIDGTLPLGVNAPIYDVPVPVLAQALTDSTNVSFLSLGDGVAPLSLPMTGGMSPTELPTLASANRMSPRDDQFTPYAGVFSGVLDGFADGMTGMPGQAQVGDVSDTVTGTVAGGGEYHVLPQPLPESRSDVPFQAVSGDLFGGDVLTAGLPVTGDLPLDATPLGDVPLAELPAVGDLTGVTTPLPAAGDLTDVTTQLPAVPAVPEVAGLADVPAVPNVANLAGAPAVPAVPAELPAVADADVTEIVPTVPSAGDVPQLPATPEVPAELPAGPSLNTMPVETPADLPVGVPGDRAVPTPGGASIVDGSSLSATKAALANLFTAHPIA